MDKEFFPYMIPKLNILYTNFRDFFADHNIEILNNCANIIYLKQLLAHLGYSIEISEMSSADMSDKAIEGKNWIRLNKFRWDIVLWDKEGRMLKHIWSDQVIKEDLKSEDDALINAIHYIIDNYKTIEQ